MNPTSRTAETPADGAFFETCILLTSAHADGSPTPDNNETDGVSLSAALEKPVTVKHADYAYTASLSRLKDGIYALTHRWEFYRAGDWRVRAGIRFPFENERLFAPTVLYRNNDRGEGAFLKADMAAGFALREDRSPLPGCLCLYNGSAAIFSSLSAPGIYRGGKENLNEPTEFSAYTQKKDGYAVLGLELPGRELPFSYQGKTRQIFGYEGRPFKAENCDRHIPCPIERVQYLYLSGMRESNAETGMLETYRRFITALDANSLLEHAYPAEAADWENWRKLKLRHLYHLLEKTDKGAYLKMGKGNGGLQYVYEFTGASFLVKSLEAALIFARSEDFTTAESIGRFFLQAEQPANSGVYRDNHNLATGEWGGYLGIAEDQSYKYLVNARCNGEAMISYLRLYEVLSRNGMTEPEFLELPKRTARFYLDCQIRGGEFDGCFGRWWTADGKAKNLLGTNGAYIVLFFLRLAAHAENAFAAELLAAAKQAAGYYLKLIDKADFYGDTLDADAYDKESAAVLLRMCLDLYEATGDELYKNAAVKAADFAITWIWLYNARFPDGTPLAAEGFRTAGMTAVSIAHHHLDFYGIYLARDFFRLERVCAEPLYGTLARDMANACLQLVATPEKPLGKPTDFAGWQPEQINHTAWDYFDRPDRQKGYCDICIAWVPVLTLGAYDLIRDELP